MSDSDDLAADLREALAEGEMTRAGLRRLRRHLRRGVRRLRRAMRSFEALGYDTDVSDLADFLEEAETALAATGKALAGDPPLLPGEPDENY